MAATSSPLVSVVIAVRDRPAYLKRAIDSILTQTLQDLELIVVDDGSTDPGTAKVLADAAADDPRVHVIRQDPLGISTACNRGISEARSLLIARLDSDDIALPDRLERQVAWLDRHPEIGVLGGAIISIDTNERKLGYYVYTIGTPEVLRETILRGPVMAHPTVMMRKDVVVAAGAYRPEFNSAEDYDLWLRVSERTGLANLAEPLTYYRLHFDQVTSRMGKRQARLAELARRLARLRQGGGVDPIDAGLGLEAAMLQVGLDFSGTDQSPG